MIHTKLFSFIHLILLKIVINYFIIKNTNEIPGELSRENMISSHVKITCYFQM